MSIKIQPCLLVGLLFLSVSAGATEPDFYIHFDECKGVFAPLYLPKSPAIKVDDKLVPFLLQCIRHGEFMDCQVDFKGGGTGIKGNILKYKINIDSPPFLSLELTPHGTENIVINTSENAAVISTLMVATNVVGSKVCHGSYFTNFQLKNE